MPPLLDVFKLLWNRRSFRLMSMAAGLHAFVSYGVGGWMAPFLQRVHDLQSGDTANWLAPVSAIPAALGAFLGGYLCDRFGQKDARIYIWIPALQWVSTRQPGVMRCLPASPMAWQKSARLVVVEGFGALAAGEELVRIVTQMTPFWRSRASHRL